MLNLDVGGLEEVHMEQPTHFSITAAVCGSIFAVVWYFSAIKESRIAHEVVRYNSKKMVSKDDWTPFHTLLLCLAVFYFCYGAGVAKEFYSENIQAMMRKISGLEATDDLKNSLPLELKPHSYFTLLISVAVTIFIILLLWLIKITLFEGLIKIASINNFIKILANGPDLRKDEIPATPSTQSYISSREQILATCKDLDVRMTRIELCLGPLAKNLDRLSQHVDEFQCAAQPETTCTSNPTQSSKEGAETISKDLLRSGVIPEIEPSPSNELRNAVAAQNVNRIKTAAS